MTTPKKSNKNQLLTLERFSQTFQVSSPYSPPFLMVFFGKLPLLVTAGVPLLFWCESQHPHAVISTCIDAMAKGEESNNPKLRIQFLSQNKDIV